MCSIRIDLLKQENRQGNEQKQVAVHQILKSPSIKFIKKKSLSISNIFILSNGRFI
jgi:hypothetical protein